MLIISAIITFIRYAHNQCHNNLHHLMKVIMALIMSIPDEGYYGTDYEHT
jgi:hypothetical protein